MRAFTFWIFGLGFPLICFGQNLREGERLLVEGNKLLNEGNFREAGNYYRESVLADSLNIEANIMTGICLLNYARPEALSYLMRVRRMDSAYRPDIHYLIGMSLQSAYRFNEALGYFKLFSELRNRISDEKYPSEAEVRQRIAECNYGLELLRNPRPIEINNLGSSINSMYSDYAPVVDGKEAVLIFTSRRKSGNTSQATDRGAFFEDIYYSTREDSSWSPAMNVGKPINSPYHESVICLSPAGDRVYIYKDIGEGDVFVSTLEQNGWSEPVAVQVVNSPYSERSLTISTDGSTIIFSSNRPGGFGGFDLYKISFDGKYWSKPQNLGPGINTSFDEDSPAFSADNKRIYFSSKGWKGMGGFDIFVASLDGPDEPVNLGYPVNTPEDDIYFIPAVSGNRGYFASVRSEGLGELDIYSIQSLEGPIAISAAPDEKEKTESESKPGSKPKLETLFFEFGETRLLPPSEETLLKNLEMLKNDESITILLVGHTDNIGSEEENAILAMERAMKVAILLKKGGISESRIRLEARGECCPIVSNSDDERIYMNRRVEFVVIKE